MTFHNGSIFGHWSALSTQPIYFRQWFSGRVLSWRLSITMACSKVRVAGIRNSSLIRTSTISIRSRRRGHFFFAGQPGQLAIYVCLSMVCPRNSPVRFSGRARAEPTGCIVHFRAISIKLSGEHPAADLILLDRFEQSLEIALPEAVVPFSLNELKEDRADDSL